MSYIKALPFSIKVYQFEKVRGFSKVLPIIKKARPFPFRC
jgi:hypothetical protein